MPKLAVYGTLKRNCSAHGLIGNSEYIGSGVTDPEYTMFGSGFPKVVSRGSTRIKVEVFDVPKWKIADLDRYEGVPDLFYRRIVDTTQGKAWMYLFNETNQELTCDKFPIIEGGEW